MTAYTTRATEKPLRGGKLQLYDVFAVPPRARRFDRIRQPSEKNFIGVRLLTSHEPGGCRFLRGGVGSFSGL
jgi:hypothetical protein